MSPASPGSRRSSETNFRALRPALVMVSSSEHGQQETGFAENPCWLQRAPINSYKPGRVRKIWTDAKARHHQPMIRRLRCWRCKEPRANRRLVGAGHVARRRRAYRLARRTGHTAVMGMSQAIRLEVHDLPHAARIASVDARVAIGAGGVALRTAACYQNC